MLYEESKTINIDASMNMKLIYSSMKPKCLLAVINVATKGLRLQISACVKFGIIIEPSHEIMALFVLRKLTLQTRMRSHPVGLDV